MGVVGEEEGEGGEGGRGVEEELREGGGFLGFRGGTMGMGSVLLL